MELAETSWAESEFSISAEQITPKLSGSKQQASITWGFLCQERRGGLAGISARGLLAGQPPLQAGGLSLSLGAST